MILVTNFHNRSMTICPRTEFCHVRWLINIALTACIDRPEMSATSLVRHDDGSRAASAAAPADNDDDDDNNDNNNDVIGESNTARYTVWRKFSLLLFIHLTAC